MAILKIIIAIILVALVLFLICLVWFRLNQRGKVLAEGDVTKEALPSKYILSKKPLFLIKEDIGQTYVGDCGAYTAQAVLNYFGKDTKEKPRDYYLTWITRQFKSLLPQAMVRLLKHYGVDSEVKIAKNLTDEDKIKVLKQEVLKGFPVMLFVGSGYQSDGTYILEKRKYPGHYLSVWGYDDEKGVFYIYNNALYSSVRDPNLANGNTLLKYEDVLTDWYGGFYMLGVRFTYISMIK
jgi:hypothetical protein